MKITENIENTIVPNDTKLIKNENKNLQELKIQILEEENKLLLKTNEALIHEIRSLKDKLQGCGLCITCVQCNQYMTAEDKAIANGKAYYEKTWNLAYGDDF